MKSLLTTLFFISVICLNAQSKDVFIEVTFSSGPFAGTHKFTPEKGNYLSQINLEFFDGYSNLNASKLIAENGIQIHYINRTFLGEASKGKHKAKNFTEGCGHFNFIDQKNEQSYKRIDGDFTGCLETSITEVTPWKDGIIKKRRVVSGQFTDTVQFEYTMDDGSEKTEIVEVTVNFMANESRR